MITFRSKTDVTDADAIFSEINSRFVAAIMMHGQMADYFDSVGRLMVEVFDMLQAMILDADFRDERQAIMQQIRKLADS